MTFKDILKIVRKLAKKHYNQILYAQAKELKLKMFKNELNFISLQLDYLNFLNFYSNLYLDIALGEIGDEVLQNEIYEDAYMVYKRKKDSEQPEIKEDKKEKKGPNKNFSWVFKRPHRN